MSHGQLYLLDQVLGGAELGRGARLKADLEHVVLVGGEGELALAGALLVVQNVVLRVDHLELGGVAGDLGQLVLALHQDVLVDLFFEALARVGRQVEHERVSGRDDTRKVDETRQSELGATHFFHFFFQLFHFLKEKIF